MPSRTVRVTRPELRRFFPDRKWYLRVQALPDHRLVFVKNAKVATSSIALWLHRLQSGDHRYQPPRGVAFEPVLPSPDEVGRDPRPHARRRRVPVQLRP